MKGLPGKDYDFLDTVDWAVIYNLCIVRMPDGTFRVGLYDGVNHKLKKENRDPR